MDELQAKIVLPAALQLELQNQTRQIVKEELEKQQANKQAFPEYLNIAQACRYIGISRGTLNKYLNSGLKVAIIDNVRRIKREDLDKFLAQKTI